MGPPTRRRFSPVAVAACAAALLAGCGSNLPANPPPSNNPVAAGAANTTSAPAYGADTQAAQNISSAVSQSAQTDTGGPQP